MAVRRLLNSNLIFSLRKLSRKASGSAFNSLNIKDIIDDPEQKMVKVEWENGDHSYFPHIFLRDNCQCPSCFNRHTKSRQIDTVRDIDLHINPQDVQFDTSNDKMKITWPDQHESMFSAAWLKKRIFPKSWDTIQDSTGMAEYKQTPWTRADIMDNLPFVEYDGIMQDDSKLFEHLKNLLTLGLSIVKNSPDNLDVLPEMSKRMASSIIRKTNYGRTFSVETKPSPSNLAYTANYLPLHVDLPFYEYQPGIQLLHCIRQSGAEGEGANFLVDGNMVCQQMKAQNPEQYELLTKTKFRFNDVGRDKFGEFHMEFERPVIGLDLYGDFDSISLNNVVRDSFINAPGNEIHRIYEAYYTLSHFLRSPKFAIEYKMDEGDVLVFNNKRVLHGRSEYNPQITSRFLNGMYLDWDEVKSVFRVLNAKLENS